MGSWSKGIHSPINNLTQEDCYLVANQDVRGVGQPYAIEAGFREASLPVDPTKLYGYSISSTMASIPSPIVGKYIHLPDGTVGTPGLAWASDTDTGLYRTASGVFHVSINGVRALEFNSNGIALPSLTAGRVLYVGASSQIVDDAGLAFVDTSHLLTVGGSAGGQLRVGTVTDTSAAGDLAAGLAGASSIVFDQSEQLFSVTDSGGTGDVRFKCNGDSWYNGTGNFGFGTVSPVACVDIVDATDPQLRLGITTTDYAQFDFSGELTLTFTAASGYTTFALEGGDAGSYYLFQVRNTDNTNGGSGASVQMQVAGTSAGDPYIVFDIIGGSYWLTGADNSDSDKYKITTSALSGFSGTKGVSITSGIYTTFSPAVASSGTAYAVDISGAINTGGSNGLFRVLAAASTGQTISTEISFVHFDLGATTTWATGALADQRCVFFEAPTLAFAGASIVTRAATVYIDRAPQAGALATITNPYAFWVDAGNVRFDDDILWLSGTAFAATLSHNNAATRTYTFPDADITVAGGTGTANRLAYWTATNTLGSGPYWDGTNLGVGTTGPDAKLDVLSTSTQLRLTYTDGSVYADFTVNSSGHLLLTPSGYRMDMNQTIDVGETLWVLANGSNVSTSQSRFVIEVGGSSAGDPYIMFNISGTATWAVGPDNSDSDKFKVSASTNLGTNDYLTITTGGAVLVANGSAGAPTWSNTTTPTNGIYFNSSATVDMSIAGNRTFAWSATSYFIIQDSATIELGASQDVVFSRVSGALKIATAAGVVINEAGDDRDFRVESDDEPYALMVEGTLNNIVLCAGAEPAFNSMDGGVFLADANVVPTGNPTAGGYLYSEGGALKWRGSGGTTTTIAAS